MLFFLLIQKLDVFFHQKISIFSDILYLLNPEEADWNRQQAYDTRLSRVDYKKAKYMRSIVDLGEGRLLDCLLCYIIKGSSR
jgi:hypothetical protein